MRLDDVRKGSDKMFQKIDWNNDGKISREEFLNAEHTRFNRMDRRATGEVSCAPHAHAAKANETKDAGASPPHRHFGFRHARGMGFCATFDANKDGKVTRAEFDAAMNAKFDKFAKGGGSAITGVVERNVWLRSITRIELLAIAPANWLKSDADIGSAPPAYWPAARCVATPLAQLF